MGMKFTVGDAEDVIVPEDTIFRARLNKIEPRKMEWKDKQTGENRSRDMLTWTFEILSEGDYKGKWVRGETTTKFTTDATSQFRNWCMSLLNRELSPGIQIDVDDILGLTADITVKHRMGNDKSRIFVEIDDVMSVDGAFEMQSSAPPF